MINIQARCYLLPQNKKSCFHRKHKSTEQEFRRKSSCTIGLNGHLMMNEIKSDNSSKDMYKTIHIRAECESNPLLRAFVTTHEPSPNTYSPNAAYVHVSASHSQPFTCAHCKTFRWPFWAANAQVNRLHLHLFTSATSVGQLWASNHLMAQICRDLDFSGFIAKKRNSKFNSLTH